MVRWIAPINQMDFVKPHTLSTAFSVADEVIE
jgi:hypothetical protein